MKKLNVFNLRQKFEEGKDSNKLNKLEGKETVKISVHNFQFCHFFSLPFHFISMCTYKLQVISFESEKFMNFTDVSFVRYQKVKLNL